MDRDWDHIDPPVSDDVYFDDGPPSYEDFGPPLEADGLKARSRRGRIGDSWWSRRFLDFLEDLGHGGRLGRGRSYARKGQVVDLVVETGEIRAVVQGSRPQPYAVSLTVAPIPPASWAAVEDALADRAAYAATLLDGRLPHDFEAVARGCGVELLPAGGSGLVVRCSCPDAETVCKHVAAACYLAAESFDDDPFLLLLWRGRSREELLGAMRRRRSGGAAHLPRRQVRGDRPAREVEPRDFWRAGPALDSIRVRPQAARMADAALAERGPIGLRVGPLDVEDLLGPMYLRITQAAEARAYGDG